MLLRPLGHATAGQLTGTLALSLIADRAERTTIAGVSAQSVPAKFFVQQGVLGMVGPALVAFLTWVDFSPVGPNIQWNGLGMVSGDQAHYATDVGASINPLGRVIVVAMVLAGGLLVASAFRLPQLLRFGSVAFGVVALATAVVAAVNPSVLLGDVLTDLGVDALSAKDVVVTQWLWAEVALTGMFVLSVICVEIVQRRRD